MAADPPGEARLRDPVELGRDEHRRRSRPPPRPAIPRDNARRLVGGLGGGRRFPRATRRRATSAPAFTASGTNFPVMQDIKKKVYGARARATSRTRRASATSMYTRGVVYGIIIVEAIRIAQEQVRQGQGDDAPSRCAGASRTCNLTEARIKELGAAGLFPPIKTSCRTTKARAWSSSSSGTAPASSRSRLVHGRRPRAGAQDGRGDRRRSTRRRRRSRRATARRKARRRTDEARLPGAAGEARRVFARSDDHATRSRNPQLPRVPLGEQHRGDLRPRDPRAEGRVARSAARAASSRCSARTARARRRR